MKILLLLLYFFSILYSTYGNDITADLWDIEMVVKTALEKSDIIKTAEENIKIKKIELNAKSIYGSIGFGISGGVNMNWNNAPQYDFEEDSFAHNETIVAGINIPVFEMLKFDFSYSFKYASLIPLYSLEYSDNNTWTRYLSFQLTCQPLLLLKKNTEYQGAKFLYDEEKLNLQNTIENAELEIRKQYIDTMNVINERRISELIQLNCTENYELSKQKFDSGIISQKDLNDALLEKIIQEEKYLSIKKDEYLKRNVLSRLCNMDCSNTEFQNLPVIEMPDIDKNKLLSSLMNKNMNIAKARRQIMLEKRNYMFAICDLLPDLDISAGISMPDTDFYMISPEINISCKWNINYEKISIIQKTKINNLKKNRELQNEEKLIKEKLDIMIMDWKINRKKFDRIKLTIMMKEKEFEIISKEFERGNLNPVDFEKRRIDFSIEKNNLNILINETWLYYYIIKAMETGYME